MLALKDKDHVVRYTAYQLGSRAHMPEAEVLECLETLSKPDTKRIEPQPFEGRRIQKVEDGWLILNGQLYANIVKKMQERAYKSRWQANKRAEQKTMETDPSKASNIPLRDILRRQTAEDQEKKAQYMFVDGQYSTIELAREAAKAFAEKESAQLTGEQPKIVPPY